MQKVFNVAVDIGRKLPAPAFEVNTNDLKSVKLLITITNGQTLLDLTDTTVRIAIRKPDNNIIFQDCTVKDAANGQVEIILENQAYITPGTHTAEIMCYKGSEVVAVSGTFSYKSTKGIMNDEAVESKSEFTAINQKIEEAKKLLEDAAESGVGVDEQARQDIQEVTAALADTAKKSEIQSLVTNKADKSYVDQVTQSIASGSPKGTRPTKAALDAEFPNGNTNIYVVTADGKWYYWNGTIWTPGGTYQSTGIAEKTVSRVHLSTELSTKIEEIDTVRSAVFLDKNDNVNFDLSTISDSDWYKPESSFIEPCTHPYLINLGIKNWIHLDTDEFNNMSGDKGFRDIHFRLRYPNTIGGKYFQTIFYLYSETGNINNFTFNVTFISKGNTFSTVTTTEISKELVPGYTNLWKIRKSGLIPEGEFNELWIGAPFNNSTSPVKPDMSVGGFYGKIFDSPQDGKDGFLTNPSLVAPQIKRNSDDIQKLKSDYQNIKSKHKWNAKNMVMFGDSIVWYDGQNYPDGTKSIGYLSNMNAGIGFSSMLQKGSNGGGIASNDDRYTDICDIVKTVTYDTLDLVLIAAGTNDFGNSAPLGTIGNSSLTSFDRTTFYGAYREIVEYILTKKSSIQIVLFTPLKRNSFDTANSAGHSLVDYVNAIKKIGEMYSLPVLDLYSLSGLNKKTLSIYTIDNLHLNNLGYERVTNNVITPFLQNV